MKKRTRKEIIIVNRICIICKKSFPMGFNRTKCEECRKIKQYYAKRLDLSNEIGTSKTTES